MPVKWKMSFQSEKSWCHFSLQTERFGFPKLLALERTNSFGSLDSSHKHAIFLFQICKKPCPRNAFLANLMFKRRKKRPKILCCVFCWLCFLLTPPSPCSLSTLHSPPICTLWMSSLWDGAGYVSPEHSCHSEGIPTTNAPAENCSTPWYRHTALWVIRLRPSSGEEKFVPWYVETVGMNYRATKLCPFTQMT